MYDNADFEMLLTETSKPRVTLIPAARIPERMLEDARRDRFLGPDVVHADRSMTGIMYGEKLVGFLTPRVNDGDWWRTGAIYVDKKYRGIGIGGAAIGLFFSDKKKGLALVEPENAASRSAFLKAGFTIDKRVSLQDGGGPKVEYDLLRLERKWVSST